MSKATELADKFEEYPLNHLLEVAPMLRQQDEAIRVALAAFERIYQPTRNVNEAKEAHQQGLEAIKLLREVQG